MRTTLLPPQTLGRLRDHTLQVPYKGIVVCAGVYGGGDILAMGQVRPDILYVAIDSWEGLNEPSLIDSPSAHAGKFAYSLDEFRENVKSLLVMDCQMWINAQALKSVKVSKVDMLWVDLDHAQPTKAVLDYFLPKCTETAPVLVHDYATTSYPGIKYVCDQFGEWEQLGHTLARLKR